MKLLEERIKKDGEVRRGGILKVDSFLNHRIDPQLAFFGKNTEKARRGFRATGLIG